MVQHSARAYATEQTAAQPSAAGHNIWTHVNCPTIQGKCVSLIISNFSVSFNFPALGALIMNNPSATPAYAVAKLQVCSIYSLPKMNYLEFWGKIGNVEQIRRIPFCKESGQLETNDLYHGMEKFIHQLIVRDRCRCQALREAYPLEKSTGFVFYIILDSVFLLN